MLNIYEMKFEVAKLVSHYTPACHLASIPTVLTHASKGEEALRVDILSNHHSSHDCLVLTSTTASYLTPKGKDLMYMVLVQCLQHNNYTSCLKSRDILYC